MVNDSEEARGEAAARVAERHGAERARLLEPIAAGRSAEPVDVDGLGRVLTALAPAGTNRLRVN